jgi:hypothetical protein
MSKSEALQGFSTVAGFFNQLKWQEKSFNAGKILQLSYFPN